VGVTTFILVERYVTLLTLTNRIKILQKKTILLHKEEFHTHWCYFCCRSCKSLKNKGKRYSRQPCLSNTRYSANKHDVLCGYSQQLPYILYFKTRESAIVDGLDYQIPVTGLTQKRHLSCIPIGCLRDFTNTPHNVKPRWR